MRIGRRRRKQDDAATATQQGQNEEFSVYYNGQRITQLSDIHAILRVGTVTRELAEQVPAVVSTRNRLTAILSALPLELRNEQNERIPSTFLARPEEQRIRALTIANTGVDLMYHGVAYWRTTRRFSTGFPRNVEYLAFNRVSVQNGEYYVDGLKTPHNDMITFEGLHQGVLTEAAAAIRDAIRIQRAAALFTDSPLPLGFFTARMEGHDPEQEEITKFLAEWEANRRAGAYGYVPSGFKLEVPGIDPEKLQLADTKREVVVDIGRATGANLESLGISTTSRTYFNGNQVRQEELDFVAGLYTVVIAERLSMPDVTPIGHRVVFSRAGWLRGDPLTRARVYQLGLETGMYTYQEIREEEDRTPLPPGWMPPKEAAAVAAAKRQARVEKSAGKTPSDTPEGKQEGDSAQ